MVFREDPDGLIIIMQPAHSWIAGQLAQRWGNDAFGSFAPFEEVCLAAEQHDMGFLLWETAPTLDPKTGRPHDFMHMPTGSHLIVWAAGVQKVMAYSRYAALLVSHHYTSLCQLNKVDTNPRSAQAIQGFLDQQHAIQAELLASLRDAPLYASCCADAVISRNRQLVAVWDWMSILICRGLAGEESVANVPARNDLTTLKITAPAPGAKCARVTPWPFATSEVKLVCDGRRFPQTFTDEREMRLALREAPAVTLTISLISEASDEQTANDCRCA